MSHEKTINFLIDKIRAAIKEGNALDEHNLLRRVDEIICGKGPS